MRRTTSTAFAPSTFEDTVPDTPTAPLGGYRLDIRFTGSGSEYLRIWIVNLVLTIVTLGVYYPWAKARRLRYFHGNTQVGGHPLDFHGEPKKMLRGYVLVGAMLVLYSVAGNFSPLAGLVAFLIVAGLWPLLLKSSLQFRLANTSWRGLRFRFKGSVADAYRALLPLFLPGLLIVAALLGVPDREQPPAWYGVWVAAVSLVTVLIGPWLWWNLKKYQHDHYALGPWQTTLRASRASFYGVFLKTVGVLLMLGVGASLSIGLLVGVGVIAGFGRATPLAALMLGLASGLAFLVVTQLVPRPYFTSRMQNLLWSRTGADQLRFDSALRFWPLLGLTAKNWLLMVVTLGLYWPFAAVAMHRMRVQAVSVTTDVDLDTLAADWRDRTDDATGDAAGDLFGLDIGL
jgi:uncharacterized membrane protein YjgN (DUF898 family)